MTGATGGGAPDDENDRETWLYEDEDVWGEQTDAPPPVLGADD